RAAKAWNSFECGPIGRWTSSWTTTVSNTQRGTDWSRWEMRMSPVDVVVEAQRLTFWFVTHRIDVGRSRPSKYRRLISSATSTRSAADEWSRADSRFNSSVSDRTFASTL